MASLTISEVATSSAFMGAALKGAAAPSKARVCMAFSRDDLERKPLSLLRVMAIQRGVKGSPRTKQELVLALLGLPVSSLQRPTSSTSSYQTSVFSPPYQAHSSAPGTGYASDLQSKTLGELRALAKQQGIRGDTKAEIIKLLTAAGASSSSSSYSAPSSQSSSSSSDSAPSSPAPAASVSLPQSVLERKSLAELRAMARIRGLRGDTKAELVRLLASAGGSSGSNSGNGSSSRNGSYSAPSGNGAYASSYNSSNGSSNSGSPSPQTLRNLQAKSLAQLRAIANVKGVRGSTKEELVRQLAPLV